MTLLGDVGVGIGVQRPWSTTSARSAANLKMVAAMGQLPEAITGEIPAVDKKDEIGLMAKAVLIFKENMIRPGLPLGGGAISERSGACRAG
jgi:methyl-accepting chemotaxis protein